MFSFRTSKVLQEGRGARRVSPISLSLGRGEMEAGLCGPPVSPSGLKAPLVTCAGSTARFPRGHFVLVLGRNRSSLDHFASMQESTGAWSGVSKPTTSAL